MIISNKLHRGTSIAAAVVLLLTLIFSTGVNAITVIQSLIRSGSPTGSYLSSLAFTAILTLLPIIALFRGKKDVVAAVFFLITAAIILFRSVLGNITSIISYIKILFDSYLSTEVAIFGILSGLIYLVANLINMAFRGLLALECLTPGKISGSKMKALLLVLPIANIALVALGSIARQLFMIEYGFGDFFLSVLVPAVLSAVLSVGIILLGLAFSIPVCEKSQEVAG